MTTQPTVENVDRTITYNPVASTGPFPVPFPLYDGTGADLLITLDDEVVAGWTFAGTQVSGFYGAPNTWVDGSVTFAGPISGELRIDGDRAPRRVSNYEEGRGIPARDQNVEWNILTAIAREIRLRCRRLEGRVTALTAELAGYLATIVAYIAQAAGHASAAAQSADEAESWAEAPYGVPVISDADGRSALHWSVISSQWATEAQAWAATVGGLIYDFGLLSEATTSEEDWGTL